ncbi:hypothetical protein MFLO_09552 [Listeria floridensis FSL S10-1187]|uniref:Lipoprotein n=1 Tax=Listeria floridensis FSL S10-1187 TaxID=1265817 RepID=A0ABN0RE79_9LIST|nr:hypothetical protein MFLO_09552 [Listeria floridensis FSL S10-1187]
MVSLGIIFGIFQREEVLDDYEVAYEIGDKLYEVFPISSTDIGLDKKKQGKHLYFRVNSYYNLEYLFRIAYGQFELNEPSTVKGYAGRLDYSVADNAYVTQEDVFATKKDQYAVYSFHNKMGKEIYRYDPEKTSSDPYVVRIKPTILQGYKKSDVSSYDDFVDITELFHDKLDEKVTVRVDESKRMVIFSIKKS